MSIDVNTYRVSVYNGITSPYSFLFFHFISRERNEQDIILLH